MGLDKCCSIYEIQHGEKHLVLSAPSIDEANWAFDELKRKLSKYKDTTVEWQYTYFDDEPAIGEIR